jgi:hypothetical protein
VDAEATATDRDDPYIIMSYDAFVKVPVDGLTLRPKSARDAQLGFADRGRFKTATFVNWARSTHLIGTNTAAIRRNRFDPDAAVTAHHTNVWLAAVALTFHSW